LFEGLCLYIAGILDIAKSTLIFTHFDNLHGAVELEVWRYAPQRIKTQNTKEGNVGNDAVDPYSLYLCLENMDDDRVQLALEELMKGID
jgi:hypothetical protein